MGLRRNRLVALVAAVVLTLLPAVASSSPAAAAETRRIAGPDRYATAAATSAVAFPAGSPTVFFVTGSDFPDALAAGPAAAAEGAPVLLVSREAVPRATLDEVGRLGATRGVVVGGESAVGPEVVAQLAGVLPDGVERIAGTDRFDTAARVSARFFAGGSPAVFVANGRGFADALAGGAAAAAFDAPLLLTEPDSVPAPLASELQRLGATDTYVLGGTRAVSDEVVADLTRRGLSAERLAGADRYATAVAASQFFPTGVIDVLVATGVNFPDALAGSAAAGALRAPLLLVAPGCMPPAVSAEIDRLAPATTSVLGGEAAVSAAAAAGQECPPAPRYEFDEAGLADFVMGVHASANGYWGAILGAPDAPYEPSAIVLTMRGGANPSACGAVSEDPADPDASPYASPAFYCPAEETVFLSLPWLYREQYLAFSEDGADFAVATVIAHEVAHHVQLEVGIDAPTVRQGELQADCFAGTWSDSERANLEPGDVEEARASLQAAGDYNVGDPEHHGTPEERSGWWQTGFDTGDPSVCFPD